MKKIAAKFGLKLICFVEWIYKVAEKNECEIDSEDKKFIEKAKEYRKSFEEKLK